jgi:hypothetical protein
METHELQYWGFSEALGPVLRRRFRGTAEKAAELAQKFADERCVPVDYWDEADKTAAPARPADSLRTVQPSPEVVEARRQREAAQRAIERGAERSARWRA